MLTSWTEPVEGVGRDQEWIRSGSGLYSALGATRQQSKLGWILAETALYPVRAFDLLYLVLFNAISACPCRLSSLFTLLSSFCSQEVILLQSNAFFESSRSSAQLKSTIRKSQRLSLGVELGRVGA